MVASKIYVDQRSNEWIIHKAFLEIKPSRVNVLLLVADFSGQKHHVVFENKFVNGNWKIVTQSPGKPPEAYDVTFHHTGWQQDEHWLKYERLIGTDVFVRQDGGVFVEIIDFETTMPRYAPSLNWRSSSWHWTEGLGKIDNS